MPKQSPPSETIADQINDRPIVVGVGASAGGLDAITRLLEGVTDYSGMSYVIIQHLDPTHKSALVEILKRHTKIAITQVEEDTEVEPNHIYVIPPGQYLTIQECVLKLSEPQDPRGSRMAIDHFFRSLAEDQCEYGIGVILSGTGTDGTAGLNEVKQYGGLTVVQDPAEAEHAGMPRNALDNVQVDCVLSVGKIGYRLQSYVTFCREHGPLSAQSAAQSESEDLTPILNLLRKQLKHDFRRYRKNTLVRRIRRRMGLHQLNDLSEYTALLADNPKEREALRCDLLIGVTRFFRDPEAWELLEEKVLRPLVERQPQSQPIRVWSAGCATGEEAYSIAMLLHEQIDNQRRKQPFQIFATDVAEDALAHARAGLYPEAIVKDIPLERLRRFFKKEAGGYRVSKMLRESVVFANQNVLAQPPFAKLDLILCRNLLIYLQRESQDRVMSVFQFALKEGGVLFQGSTETVGDAADLFTPISKKWRIFRRTATKSWPPTKTTHDANVQPIAEFAAKEPGKQQSGRRDAVAGLVQRQVMRELDHAVVVVNQDDRVLYVDGQVDSYLQLPSGEFSSELPEVMGVTRKGLKAKLRAALREARKEDSSVTIEARVQREGQFHRCNIRIRKLHGREEHDPAMMCIFSPLDQSVSLDRLAGDDKPTQASAQSGVIESELSLIELEHELSTTRDQLQSSIADLEAANVELKASNEEAMTMNEEMQSSNEELETSKEELQSLNEELTTLNNQLEIKVEELEETTNDLDNLLVSSDVPTVFLDTNFRIRRYTPSCVDLFRFVANDIGRPVNDIKTNFEDPDLIDDAQAVLRDLQPRQKQVVSSDRQRRYRRRMLPYRTDDNRIQGVVMTFSDVTELVEAQEAAAHRLAELQTIYKSAPIGLAFIDTQLRYVSLNEEMARIDGVPVDDHLGKKVDEVLPKKLADEVERFYNQVLQTGAPVLDLEIVGQTAGTKEPHTYLVNYVPVRLPSGEIKGVNAVVRDITIRKRLEDKLSEREAHLRRVIDHQMGFVAVLETDGTLVEVGDAALHVAGLVRDDVIGKKFWDCHWWTYEDAVADRIRKAFERSSGGEVIRYDEVARVADDGRMIIDFMIQPVFDADGKVVYVIPSGVDIRQRHAVESELRETEQRLRQALRAGGMAAWEWTPKGSLWQPELYELLGISPEVEASPELFFQYVHPDDVASLKDAWSQTTAGVKDYYHEFRIVRPDGETRWIAGIGNRLHDDENSNRIYGLNWDITEQREREHRLLEISKAAESANESKSAFLANMSHEIRTPMTAILGYADMLANHLRDPDNVQCVQTIRSNGRFLLEIIDDILDLSKIDAGRFEVDRERVAPERIIADIVSLMNVRADEKHLALEVAFESELPKLIETDSKRLRQILLNLVGNAIKFTEDGTVRLSVKYEHESNQLALAIKDTGIGIDPATMNELFKPFTQADGSITRTYGGTGLGLAISRRLAEVLGGEIQVESAPGRGSTFTLLIDPGKVDKEEFAFPSSLRVTPVDVDDTEIELDGYYLIVDDRRDIRYLAQHFIESVGGTVSTAGDGQAGVDAIQNAIDEGRPFTAVCMDMQMPVLDGYGATREIRRRDIPVPIIALTANAMQGDQDECIAAGCTAFISKPIDKRKLLQTLLRVSGKDHGES